MSDDLYIGPTALAPGPRARPRFAGTIGLVLLVPLLFTFLFVVIVFYVLFGWGRVDGASMEPTLLNADRVLVTRGAKVLDRGDVVVLVSDPHTKFEVRRIKRVIALSGDTVEIRCGTAFVNGLSEPARGQVVPEGSEVSWPAVVVPEGMLYVMGDNRAVSRDSRYIGPLARADVEGRVVAVFAPVSRIRLVR